MFGHGGDGHVAGHVARHGEDEDARVVASLADGQPAAVGTEGEAGSGLDTLAGGPRLGGLGGGVVGVGGAVADAGLSEGGGGADAALDLGSRRRGVVRAGLGGGGGEGGGVGTCAKEALGDGEVVVEGDDDGGGAGRVGERARRGMAVEGIGGAADDAPK